MPAGGIESGSGETECDRRDIDAGHIETRHGDLEPLSLLTEQVLARHLHTVERHAAERIPELPELSFHRSDCYPWPVALHHQHRHAACAQRAIEGAEDHERVC